jgi:hypothetical protein
MSINLNNAPRVSKLESAEVRVDRVREALKRDIRGVVKYLFPKATFSGNEARIGDVYGTKGTSLSISIKPHDNAGLWVDHASGSDHGDVFSLWAAAMNVSNFDEVLKDCDAWLGGSSTPLHEKHQKKTAKQALEKEPDLKKVKDAEYLYTDVHGNKVCSVFRYRLVDNDGADTGKKAFSIFRYHDKKWSAPAIRPLYRLPDIAGLTDVVLVEGEKCADMLAEQGIDATTASGGSNTIMDKTDWTPLAGKRVFLWPDNDATGREYMERVGEHLEAIGCTVFHIPIPSDAGDGWDAADAIEEGLDVVHLIRNALPDRVTGGALIERWDDISYEYDGEAIEDILPRVGLATLFGPSAGGKSFLVLDIMVSIAQGLDVFGKETEACAVGYCAFEGFDGLKKRIHAIKQKRGVHGIDVDLIDAPWLLVDPAGWRAFVVAVEAYKESVEASGKRLGVLVLDTLTSATAGSDTNSQSDVTSIMKKLKRLATDMNLLILNVGHTGKDQGRGMVGSFAYKSEADAFLECVIETCEETGRVLRRSLFVDKVKDGPSNFVIADYALEVVHIGIKPNGKPITTCLVNWTKPQEAASRSDSEVVIEHSKRALEALQGGALTNDELTGRLKVSRTRVSEIMAYLTRAGRVNSQVINKRKIWELAEEFDAETGEVQ